MEPYLFGPTGDYLRTFGPLQQTLKAARVAMWTMHWQMRGLAAANPHLSDAALTARFAEGSGVTGSDFGESFVRKDWPEVDSELSRVLLVDVVAHYEGFCEAIGRTLAEGPAGGDARTLATQLQRPSVSGQQLGISDVVKRVRAAGLERRWRTSVGSRMRARGQVTQHLDDRMLVYRSFKEARNAIAHSGGRATDRSVSAHAACAAVQAEALDMKVLPQLPQSSLGARVELTWYGVIGLADMLRRTVLAVDGALSDTTTGSAESARRFREDPAARDEEFGGRVQWDAAGNWLVAQDDNDRRSIVRGVLGRLIGIQPGLDPEAVIPVLEEHGVLLRLPNRRSRRKVPPDGSTLAAGTTSSEDQEL